jgi:Na+-transporting methylmalonyl-CoA/oxaloacetate decarboxylase gamma subunit
MSDSRDLWLNVTNAGLGIVVLLLLLAVLVAVITEIVTHYRRRSEFRAELDRDLQDLAGRATRPGI